MKGKKILPLRRTKILAEVGGVVDESCVTLAVYGRDLNPDEVTKLLGVKPSRSFKRGYRKEAAARPMPHGAWFLESRGKVPNSPEVQLRQLLMKLPSSNEIWRKLRASHKVQIRFALHMSGWNRGFELSSEVIRRLDAMGVDAAFDIYAYGAEES